MHEPPPSGGGDEKPAADAHGLLQVRDIFLSSFSQIVDLPKRIKKQWTTWSRIAKIYLFSTLLLDLFVVLMTFVKDSVDDDVFRPLVVVYTAFQFCTAFHAIYAQNEYTLVGGNVLLVVETLISVWDYADDITGLHVPLWQVVLQGTWLAGVLLLASWTYRSMEGFGWKTFHEVGAKKDRLAIHSAYRMFTAALSLDFLLSVMLTLLAIMLVQWPMWQSVLVIAFCLCVPILCTIPLKKTVKAEMTGLLKVFAGIYTVGLLVEVIALVLAVLEQTGHRWHSRLHAKSFPVAWVVMVSSALAILARLALAYRVHVVVDVAFDTGLLKELAGKQMRPWLHGEPQTLYGTDGPARDGSERPSRDNSPTRYGNASPPAATAQSDPFRIERPQSTSLDRDVAAYRNSVTRASLPLAGTPNGPTPSSWSSAKGNVPILAAKTVTLDEAREPPV
eukprot:TRINITY_DN631_c0_g1_i1.p1 TRINITY_DN631_c0_g1~~TRINITY_DN631_c0_g1_i1.p1  ORF type:complete len:447 (+),score=165.84 TRINITY_DN631_c0_g1_i1:72-1412(+)